MKLVSSKTLALLAAEHGTLAGPPEHYEPKTMVELLEEDEAAERADLERQRELAEQRRRVWSVMHKLSADEQAIIQGIQAGQTHAVIARRLGMSRVAVTERLPHIVGRIQFWLGLPALPEGDELRAHLVECPEVGRRAAGRVAAFLDGDSLRDIGAAEGRDHAVVFRSINRAMTRVRGRKKCGVCQRVAAAEKMRRDFRPSTAVSRSEGQA